MGNFKNSIYIIVHHSLEWELRELISNEERELSTIILKDIEIITTNERKSELIKQWNIMDTKRENIPIIICYEANGSYNQINKLWNTVILLTKENFKQEWIQLRNLMF